MNANQIQTLAPHCPHDRAEQLAACLPGILAKYKIDTPIRIAHFLAQTCHESQGYTHFEENLNYSAKGLRTLFPKYFVTANVNDYAGHPEKIANRIYANRMRNGDEASGDGYKYRGRGMIQLTGKGNYAALTAASGHDVTQDPDWLATAEGAAESAAWYWTRLRNINAAADRDDILAVTKLVNGGTLGLDERKKLLDTAKKIFVA